MNIAIVGAGLVGRVLALNLLKQGHTLTLFDKGSKEGTDAAGFTAAGMLAPFAELETAESIIFEHGKRSIQLWPDLLKEIGLFDGYKLDGTIITAHPQDMSELNHFIHGVFLEKTKQKIVSVLESLCFQGRSQRQGTLRVIYGLIAYALILSASTYTSEPIS